LTRVSTSSPHSKKKDVDGRVKPGHDERREKHHKPVMRGLDPRIHVFTALKEGKTWMAGSSPAMTSGEKNRIQQARHARA
jgi:hypothetical protein